MMLSRELYAWYDGFSPFLIAWTALFTIVTAARIGRQWREGAQRARPSVMFTELAGLPLAVLQSACFVKALAAKDALSILLFAWWGPGFILSASYYIYCKKTATPANWYPYRLVISWLCKLNTVAFLIVFFVLGHPALMFVYSAWIINDQFGLAFLSMDADRLRRTFDDYWLLRVLYPLGLFWPWVRADMAFSGPYRAYGLLLLALWLASIAYVRRWGRLTGPPEFATLLRNMVYHRPHGHP